jgi:competence protein ComEA
MNYLTSIRTFTGLCISIGLATCVLADEQPERDSRTATSATAAEAATLDLNTASLEALASVPVIGEDGARAIIAARPYARIDDLNRLTGISAERLEQIRANVKVTPAQIPEHVVEEKLDMPQPPQKREGREKRVDLNTADLRTLESIPSIGPEMARTIVAARPFATINELDRIPGISAERLEHIRTRVTVANPEPAKQKETGRTRNPEAAP